LTFEVGIGTEQQQRTNNSKNRHDVHHLHAYTDNVACGGLHGAHAAAFFRAVSAAWRPPPRAVVAAVTNHHLVVRKVLLSNTSNTYYSLNLTKFD
jgi:hypothetical protein